MPLTFSKVTRLSSARSPGSFHVAGNFTVIYDSGMNPPSPTRRPRREHENEFAARSRRLDSINSIRLARATAHDSSR